MSSPTISISVPTHGTPSCILSICWSASDDDKSALFKSRLLAELNGILIEDTDLGINFIWKYVFGSVVLEEESTSATFVCTTPYAAGWINQATNRHLLELFRHIEAPSLVKNLKHITNKI